MHLNWNLKAKQFFFIHILTHKNAISVLSLFLRFLEAVILFLNSGIIVNRDWTRSFCVHKILSIVKKETWKKKMFSFHVFCYFLCEKLNIDILIICKDSTHSSCSYVSDGESLHSMSAEQLLNIDIFFFNWLKRKKPCEKKFLINHGTLVFFFLFFLIFN